MKDIVITGADRGLGLALCQAFLAQGERVFAGEYLADWDELKELARLYPQQLISLPLDITSEESVKKFAERLSLQTAKVDLLVANAGVFAVDQVELGEGVDLNLSQTLFKVNCAGTLRITQRLLPLLAKGIGRLCFVSSEAGSLNVANRQEYSSYCMSKAALNMAVKILFNELQPKGFTFRLYHPGYVRSYMLGEFNQAGTVSATDSAKFACRYFSEDQKNEQRLVMMDNQGVIWPF